jgi:antibiotic biosynthesis monooxygenase (ABM) superfamily enzyme
VIRILKTECNPEDEEKFNKWYNEVHIPHILKHPACLAATRCRIMDPEGEFPEYITIYEFTNKQAFEEYEKARSTPEWKAELIKYWGRDPNVKAPGASKQRGFSVKSNINCEVLKTWRK